MKRMFNLKKDKMKRNLIERIGLDRIAHFGVGAAVCAFMTLAFLFSLPDGDVLECSWGTVLLCPLVGYVLVGLLAWAKEMNDAAPDWRDLVASMLGCVFVHLGAVAGWGMHYLNGRDLITTPIGWTVFGLVSAALAVLFIRWVVRFRRGR